MSDHLFDAGAGAGALHDVAQPVQFRRAEVTSAQPSPQLRTIGGGRAGEGVGEQCGGFGAGEVVQVGLAGVVRVAEDAEQVVPELERLAQRDPVGGEGVEQRGGRPGEPAAQVQGVLDGVFRGLVADDLK